MFSAGRESNIHVFIINAWVSVRQARGRHWKQEKAAWTPTISMSREKALFPITQQQHNVPSTGWSGLIYNRLTAGKEGVTFWRCSPARSADRPLWWAERGGSRMRLPLGSSGGSWQREERIYFLRKTSVRSRTRRPSRKTNKNKENKQKQNTGKSRQKCTDMKKLDNTVMSVESIFSHTTNRKSQLIFIMCYLIKIK